MADRPAFSIVIPTRNRAVLLRQALATACAQSFDDFEIVVSDNHSSDETADVALGSADPHVRYVRTDTALAQPDSWEFAVSHARGEWVTVLGDDDGVVPSFLARLAALVDNLAVPAITWASDCWYHHVQLRPSWLDESESNHLVVFPWSGHLTHHDSGRALAGYYRTLECAPPGLVSSVVHRSALTRVRDRVGRVFGRPDPYLSAGIAVVALGEGYASFDVPLAIRGASAATISLGFFHNDRESHGVVQEFDEPDLFTLVPFSGRTAANVVGEALLRVKREFPDALGSIELNPVPYFVNNQREITNARRHAPETDEMAAWRAALRAQPLAVRRAVRWSLARASIQESLGRRARSLAGGVPAVRRVRRAIGERVDGRAPFRLVDGAEAGFSDLVGAAAFLDAQVLPALEAV